MSPTFGMTIRAARLGYHKLDGIGFVRIRVGGPPHVIDVVPFHDVPSDKNRPGQHVVWWEGGTDVVERTIRAHLRGEVTRRVQLFLNDDGSAATAPEAPHD